MRHFLTTVFILCFLTGCFDTPWNNPNSETNSDKVIYYSNFQIRPKHLDPARSYSADEGIFIDQIYEPPLQYNYYKRPYELEPLTLTEMPKKIYLDANFKSLDNKRIDKNKIAYTKYVLSLKKGMLYQPHPSFAKNEQGEPLYYFLDIESGYQYSLISDFKHAGTREVLAKDYIYQIKRMADQKNLSPIKSLLDNYIVGFKDLSNSINIKRESQHNSDWLDLDEVNLKGVKLIDNHTFEITIKGLYPQFKFWLAMRFFSPMPKEADRFYHNPGFKERNLSLDWFPIGSGPFMLTKNNPNGEMILEKNPNYNHDHFPTGPVDHPSTKFSGQPLPLIDKAIFRLEKETLPLFTKFTQGYYDRSGENHANVGVNTFDQVFNFSADGLELTPEMELKSITIERDEQPAIFYTGFNMLDPIVGGYSDKAKKLRQAISIAYNDQEYVDIFLNGQGSQAHSPIPPGVPGHRQDQAGINPFVFDWLDGRVKRKSIEYAKKLLQEAGYPNGRDEKTGKPLILNIDLSASASQSSSLLDWKRKQFEKIGIQLEFRLSDYNRFKEKVRQGNTQIFSWGWLADYPDAENFLFLLYGPNSSATCNCDSVNNTNYDNPEFNRLYEKIKVMENTPERLKLIDKMVAIVQEDAPWIFGVTPTEYYLNNAWVYNNIRHGVAKNLLKYVAIDPELRSQQQLKFNKPNIAPILVGSGFFIALIFPAARAYRRRQKETI
jgi:oligopeptide transport system substrate-binding protein